MANERRLIDADKLCVKILDGSYYNNADEDVFWEMVQDEPTVEEAVIPVRCKDCQHYNGRICEVHSEWPDQYSTGHTAYMEPDDYCSYGERRCEDEA